MGNQMRERAKIAFILAMFIVVMGIVGRMEMDAMDNRICGFILEESEMVPNGCETESEIVARMDAIRSVRSGLRTWQDGR